jgi:arginyl-tRNA--protein-N-Asp/Glu arginylyltransferase
MPNLLSHVLSPPGTCGYLPIQTACMEYKTMLDVTPAEYQAMLEHGWRRFGPQYFRPACEVCQACISIRVPVGTFSPSKTQRRIRRKCKDLRLEIAPPRADQQRLDLYQKWHAMREDERGWRESRLDEEDYFFQFSFPHPCALEFAYYFESKLVAVGIVDETENALSSVYFFYDPAYRHLSLGVASILMEIEAAGRRGRSHLYLGYRIHGCPSMEYKEHFRPHELLVGRPGPDDKPCWVLEKEFPGD